MNNDILIDLLKNYDLQNPSFRPTEIYNEGWLLRIILNEYSRHNSAFGLVSFRDNAIWFSEAMLPTKFRARKEIGRSDPFAESLTIADGVIGHINVGNKGKADLELSEGATQFVVIEAKMNSKLSKRIRNSPEYDQAARTVACMAETIRLSETINITDIRNLAYVVLAPEKRIGKSNLLELVDEDSIKKKVRTRVSNYGDEGDYKEWYEKYFEPTLKKIKVDVISWEKVIDQLPVSAKKEVKYFYDLCLQYN